MAAIAVGVVAVMLITAVTAYFVAQEFAYTAVDRSRLRAGEQAGQKGAGRALNITARTSFLLSGAQLGITVTGLLVGYAAEPLIGDGIATLLGVASIPSTVGVAVGTAVALMFCTLMQMLFGELVPKNLAIATPEPMALRLAASTTAYLWLFGWLILLLDQASNLLLRLLRIEPIHDVDSSATPRDLERIVAMSHDAGQLPAELSVLLDRVLEFPTSTAQHAMVPRTRVDTVDADEPVASVVARMATGHSRYPVVGDSGDDVLGVVHLHDVIGTEPSGTAASRCRIPVTVPSSLPLPEVIKQLGAAAEELALVIDEYGGFAGIVTVEDVAEELVGEIADEHDRDGDGDPVPLRDGWMIPGGLPLDEAQRLLDHELPTGRYQTIAGLVITHLGRLPTVGDTVEIALQPDTDELLADSVAPPKVLSATVQAIAHHVPASVFVTVRDREDGR